MKTSYKILFYFLLFLAAILIRRDLPTLPIWDGDSAGYIFGAISFLKGSGFKVINSRSFIYSGLLLPFIWLSKSIAIIVTLQKISGLFSILMMVLIWEKLSVGFPYKIFSFLTGYILIFCFSISTTTLYYELCIRPEAFFVLFSLLLTYLLLFLLDDNNSERKTFSLVIIIMLLNFFITHLIPRWGFASIVVLGVVGWKLYLSKMQIRQKWTAALSVIILYLFLISIPENYFRIKSDSPSNSDFFQTQFFYANAFVIEKDVSKIFTDSIVQKLAKIELEKAKTEFPILGYNPDVLMYGEFRNYFQKEFCKGNIHMERNFYYKTNINLLVSNSMLYSKKVVNQLLFFFIRMNPDKVFLNYKLNLKEDYRKSNDYLVDFIRSYQLDTENLSIDEYKNINYFNVKDNIYQLNSVFNHLNRFLIYFLYFFVCLAIFYIIIFSIIKRNTRYCAAIVIFGLYFFQIFTVAFIITIDNCRYFDSIKHFWVLIYAFSLCVILNSIPYKKIIVPFKIFTDFIKPFALLILFFVLIFDSIKILYYKNQYHTFEPFLQAWPNKYILPEKKDSNEIRILCLGGSTTANLTLSDSCRYPFLLQKKLQSLYPNKKIVVLNLGMDWFSTKHLLINYTTEAKYYQPDIVICMEAINDLYRSFTPRGCDIGIEKYSDQYTHFYGPSINGANPTTFEYYLLSKSIFGDIPGSFINKVKVKYPLSEFKSIKPYVRNLSALANYVKADGALFILVTQPNIYKSTMTDEEQQHCWFNTGFCNRRVAWNKMEYPDVPSMSLAMDTFLYEERNLTFSKNILLIDAEKEIPKNLNYFIDDVHYTNKGADSLSSIICNSLSNSIIK
jgi:hypothetical protein